MIDLIKLFMANPINAIIAVLSISVLVNHLGLIDVRVVQATITEQQTIDKTVNTLVFDMRETLARIDENVNLLRGNK